MTTMTSPATPAGSDTGTKLREAAALLRERARWASPGPWESLIEGRDHWGGDGFIYTGDVFGGIQVEPDITERKRGWTTRWSGNQDYIAAMNPLVALAVAAWLEHEAAQPFPMTRGSMALSRDHAENVATAFLIEARRQVEAEKNPEGEGFVTYPESDAIHAANS